MPCQELFNYVIIPTLISLGELMEPNLKKVMFTSKKEIEDSVGAKNIAVISIVNTGDAPAALNENFGPVLRLIFDDIDEVESDKVLMSSETADDIWRFVNNVSPEIETIWVHCTYGISRSAGVAKAIADRFNLFYPEAYSIYNKKVYRTLRQSMLREMYPDEDSLII